ncbi:MAG: hypothetical protein GXP16_07175 [Gammaproteobacteria bacterium]|nr:hypothetical protein [Gammaproteobacteria bacterium]
MSECSIIDNWDPLGMRGSGSNDVSADEVEVPAHMVVAQPNANTPRNKHYNGRLYRCPSRVVFISMIDV